MNVYGHSSGYFKIQIGYADFSHFIDHSKTMFNGHFYTICYSSLPLTLKLTVNDGTITGNGGTAFLFDIDGSEIKGVKCDEVRPTKPGCIVGHPNADVNEEAYKIGSFYEKYLAKTLAPSLSGLSTQIWYRFYLKMNINSLSAAI